MGSPYRQSGADVAFWLMIGLFALGEYLVQFRSFWAVIRGRGGERAERWSLVVVLVALVGGLCWAASSPLMCAFSPISQ